MGSQINSVEVIVLSAAIGLVTSAITAFVTVRLQMYQERARWQKDFALKLAEFQSTSPGQAEKVAQQFAIGVLMIDEGESNIPRKREFIPFYGCLAVGTDPSNNIVIKENLCSSKHLLFFASHSDVYAVDLKSQNGTWVNGRLVELFSVKHAFCGRSAISTRPLGFRTRWTSASSLLWQRRFDGIRPRRNPLDLMHLGLAPGGGVEPPR